MADAKPDRPDTDDLVSNYPPHIPMGLPLPKPPPPERPDSEYVL